jgi:hypothetical protein
MGRSSEALPLYARLARITTVAINGLPADLQARKTRCALFADLSRPGELRQEAAALRADLDAGRWPLDRAGYEYVSRLVDTSGTLSRVPVAGGEQERIGVTLEGNIQNLQVQTDGRGFYFTLTGGQNRTELWALENFLPEAALK